MKQERCAYNMACRAIEMGLYTTSAVQTGSASQSLSSVGVSLSEQSEGMSLQVLCESPDSDASLSSPASSALGGRLRASASALRLWRCWGQALHMRVRRRARARSGAARGSPEMMTLALPKLCCNPARARSFFLRVSAL